MVGVFIQVKDWLKRRMSQSEGGGTRRGVTKQKNRVWRVTAPKWRPVVKQGCGGERASGWSEEEET